jgi:hypothetical protein
MLNPETLLPETKDARSAREAETGVHGIGLHVLCRPFPEDPGIIRTQHRVVCLHRPYATCPSCPHSSFTLFFRGDNREVRESTVKCPRWEQGISDRYAGRHPDSYVDVPSSRCEDKPFEFCPSCPSQPALVQLGLDKAEDGWYGRWSRLKEEERDDRDI